MYRYVHTVVIKRLILTKDCSLNSTLCLAIYQYILTMYGLWVAVYALLI